MDQLRAMRVFARIVDEGSFAGAARALDLAPAVVTRVLGELEDHLGARLLNRTTRSIALTEVGEAYLQRARQIVADVEEAEALASHHVGEPSGPLRVIAPPAFVVHQLAKHLPEFRRRYPKVNLELTVPGPVETVDENHDISIVMTGYKPLDGEFIARRIARAEVITCASPEYLDARGRPQHPRDLLDHESLLPAVPSARREITFQRGVFGDDEPPGETYTIHEPSPAVASVHLDTLYAAALHGMGITGVPSFVAAEALMEGALERVLPQWQLLTITIYAAMPTRRHLPARTRAFIDFLVETFGGGDHDPWLAAAGCPTPENCVDGR